MLLRPIWSRQVDADHPRAAQPPGAALPDRFDPRPPPVHRTGRPRAWPVREIINGIFYVMRAGCPWRLPPSDLPLGETIYRWFASFRDDGRLRRSITLLSWLIASRPDAKPVRAARNHRQPERQGDRLANGLRGHASAFHCGSSSEDWQAHHDFRNQLIVRPRRCGCTGPHSGRCRLLRDTRQTALL